LIIVVGVGKVKRGPGLTSNARAFGGSRGAVRQCATLMRRCEVTS